MGERDDDEDDFEGMPMLIIITSVIGTIFLFCLFGMCCCFFCCLRARKNQSVHSTPVVINAQTFQPTAATGVYPVAVQINSVNQSIDHTYQQNQETIFQLRNAPTPSPSRNSTNSSSLSSYQTNFSAELPNVESLGYDSHANPPTYQQAIGLEQMQKSSTISNLRKS